MSSNHGPQAITRIETFGVEQIPDHERHAPPLDLFRLIFGGANTFATAVLGSFPVLFGLSFEAGLWAIVLGVVAGSLILAPMGLFGALNGTNNAVSSGAHFGVHGRIVGSFLSLLAMFPEPAEVYGPQGPRWSRGVARQPTGLGQTT